MTTTSGHSIHLMPGDHTYDTPTIPIVVIWNGLNHYCPTYASSPNTVLKWKMSCVNHHLRKAISTFGEIEGDLNDTEDFELCQQFHVLRNCAVLTQQMLAAKCTSIGQVVIPKPHVGPDPRDIHKKFTRQTTLPDHPCPSIQGQQSKTLESVLDVSKACNWKLPLIPDDQPTPPKTDSETTKGILTQSYGTPIMSLGGRDYTIIPKCPTKQAEEKEFSFPVGKFMEVKRKLGGQDIPPVVTIEDNDVPPAPRGPPPKPLTHTIPPKSTPENHAGKTGDSRKRAIPEKPCDSGSGKQSQPKKGKGKGVGKTSTPTLKVTIPLGRVRPPPQVSAPAPQVSAAASQATSALAAQAVSSSSSGTGAKSKVQLIKCTLCSYQTYQRGDFNLHMDKHRGVRYKCTFPGCRKDFGSEKAKNQHFRTNHFDKKRSECPFPTCDFSHNDHGVTKVHLYTDHGVGKEPKCRHPDCKDRDLFTNYRVFERHMKNYHKPRVDLCPHCKKMYKGIENLKLHIATAHKKEVTEQCDQCGKFYASKKSLKAHQEEQH